MDGVRILELLTPATASEAIDWEEVFHAELPRVLNYFRYRVLNQATAEDLTSLTFEKAWRGRGRYRKDRAAVATWLMAIARNVAIDHFRRDRREVGLEDASVTSDDTPEAATLRDERLQRLSALLGDLPERERELLALKYGAGATNRAIATFLGLSESNVGTILHRTVGLLRTRWDEGGVN